jgi:hypothetical protein
MPGHSFGSLLGVTLALLAGLGGCASSPPSVDAADSSPDVVECRALLAAELALLAEQDLGVSDSRRIEGFPGFRIDRFLASFRESLYNLPPAHPRLQAWLARARALDAAARQVESPRLAALPAARQQNIEPQTTAHCAEIVADADGRSPQRLRQLLARADIASEYSWLRRILGGYVPVASVLMSRGAAREQERLLAAFTAPMPEAVAAWAPADAPAPGHSRTVAPDWASLPRDALGIPELTTAAGQWLLRHHAPVLLTSSTAPSDVPGAVVAAAEGDFHIDVQQPVVYTRIDHARLGEDVLLQLSYLYWFSERPATGRLDLVAGHLDGFIWRVTLDQDGTPLLHESIHACGCWHLAFPGERLQAREAAPGLEDRITIPGPAPTGPGRMVLQLAAGTHQLQRVSREGAGAVPAGLKRHELKLEPENALQALTDPHGRPFHAAEGIVLSSQRPERWLLWPSGIRSPGAQRSWSRHATAFVGERHFDDPRLIERYFRQQPDGQVGLR